MKANRKCEVQGHDDSKLSRICILKEGDQYAVLNVYGRKNTYYMNRQERIIYKSNKTLLCTSNNIARVLERF